MAVNKIPPPSKPEFSIWNRLEGRPRVHNLLLTSKEENKDFSKSLKVEVYDALWMLTRQWQFGELQGDDAGTAIDANVEVTYYPVNKFMERKGEEFLQFNNDALPIEARVEAEPIIFDLKAILQISVYFKRCLLKEELPLSIYDEFVAILPYKPLDTNDATETIAIQSDKKLNIIFKNLEGKLIDASIFIPKIFNSSAANLVESTISVEALKSLKLAIQNLRIWFKNSIYYNESKINWDASRLEYQFSQGLKKDNYKIIKLSSKEFYHGRLDWYNFEHSEFEEDDTTGVSGDLGRYGTYGTSTEKNLIPTPIQFNGMPDSRWWAFEDGRINFGKLEVGLNDLATLQLMEFGLIKGDDWCVLPFKLPAGVGCEVTKFVVWDVFGEETTLKSLNENDASDENKEWKEWSAFSLSKLSNPEEEVQFKSNFLFVPAVIHDLQESNPIELIRFKRDEWNNLVWAIEDIVPGVWGNGIDGHDNYRRIHEYENSSSSESSASDADFHYELMTEIPENWFAFIPKRKDDEQIQFVLATRRKNINTSEKVKPQGLILSEQDEGLFILREEEIPSLGLKVQRTFQRTRWTNGKVITWVGRRKFINRNNDRVYFKVDQIKK